MSEKAAGSARLPSPRALTRRLNGHSAQNLAHLKSSDRVLIGEHEAIFASRDFRSTGWPIIEGTIIKIVAFSLPHEIGGTLRRGLSFSILREAIPRFRQFEGKGPVFGVVQLCRKPVTFLRSSAELGPPWHNSRPLLKKRRHTEVGNADGAKWFHARMALEQIFAIVAHRH